MKTRFTLFSVKLFFVLLQIVLAWSDILTMASGAASGSGQSSQDQDKSISKKNYSHVHEEYEVVHQYHPGLEKFGPSSRCKECKKIISGGEADSLSENISAPRNWRKLVSLIFVEGECLEVWTEDKQVRSNKMLAIWVGGSNLPVHLVEDPQHEKIHWISQSGFIHY